MPFACAPSRSTRSSILRRAFSFLTAVGLVLGAKYWASAGPLAETYVIYDGGQARPFEVARDEFYVWSGIPHAIRYNPLPSAEASRQKAAELKREQRADVSLVLYEEGVSRSIYSRRVLTGNVLFRIKPGTDVERLQSQLTELTSAKLTKFSVRGWRQARSLGANDALELRDWLRTLAEIEDCEVELARVHEEKLPPNDSLFGTQWHLLNTGQNGGTPGLDLEITNVWDSWRGSGVVVGVVDNGIEAIHPDLQANLLPALGTNLNSNSFSTNNDRHGSAVAGLIAGVGNNGLGVVGVAFESKLADIRLLGEAATDAQDAVAMLHGGEAIQVKNSSWGASDGTGILDGAGAAMSSALEEATERGRGGLGTVFVFAGGNGRVYGEDVNYDGYANHSRVIAVGAVTDQGDQAAFSEPGACLVVCAPSGSGTKLCSGGRQALTTTDLMGGNGYNYNAAFCELSSPDYTQNFSGTSGATALVSGVIALMLDGNPGLGWRDVKEILMRSARKVLLTDADWQTNAAGLSHNHRVGAGLVSARQAVELSRRWKPLEQLATAFQVQTGLNLTIPDNNATGLTRTFTFTKAGFRVETVALRLTAPHEYFGDLVVTLTSPDGTRSRLAEQHNSSGTGYNGWTFTSVRHWGEFASGTWTVKISDLSPTRTGTLQALELEFFGSQAAIELSLLQTNQGWHLSAEAACPGARWAFESSEDTGTWKSLTEVRIGQDGRAGFDDLSALQSARLYRARLLEH